MTTHPQEKVYRVYVDSKIPSDLGSRLIGDTGGTLMNDEILNECRQAKERVAALFEDVDTLMDFLMKRREQRIKQGAKYADFSPYRKKKYSNRKSIPL